TRRCLSAQQSVCGGAARAESSCAAGAECDGTLHSAGQADDKPEKSGDGRHVSGTGTPDGSGQLHDALSSWAGISHGRAARGFSPRISNIRTVAIAQDFNHRSPTLMLLRLSSLTCVLLLASAALAQRTNLQQANEAFHAGYAAASNGDLATARQQFQRVVQLAPQIEEGHSALGAVLCQLGEYPAAITQLEAALKLKPADQAAQQNLALAYAQTGAWQKALPIFENLEKSQAALSPDLLAAYARALASAQQFSAAIRETKAAIAAAPQNAMLYDQLGSIYAQMQNWPEAQNTFAEALRLDAGLASAHLHLGVVLANERQLPLAIEELTTAAQLGPKNAAAQLELGKALVSANQDENAIPHFQQAAALDPNLIEAEDEQARALQRMGKAKEAVPYYQRALAINANDATAHQDLGVAYLQESDLDDAIREFRAGLALAPENPQLHYNLGLAF